MALKSLGKAGEEGGPLFAKATPVVRKAAKLAKTGEPTTNELAKLFTNLKQEGGWDGLTELIYNSAATLNGYDQYGHFGRTLVTLTNCLEYEAIAARRLGLRREVQRTENAGEASSATQRRA